MNDGINSGENGFSSTSIANMNNYLGGTNCYSSTTTTPTPTPNFYELKSGLSTSSQSWCFDLANGDTTNGTPIWLWPCNGTNAQHWTIDSEHYIRSKIDTNKCVVTSGSNLNAGTVIWDCIPNYPAMQWDRYTDFPIRPRNDINQCMDVRGDAVASQCATIQLDNCGNDGRDNQVFQFP
jgi:hypothetical protein